MRITAFLLLFTCSALAQEPYLRIEKIDPDGKKTVRETPKSEPQKKVHKPAMSDKERALWEENQRLKAQIQKLDPKPRSSDDPYMTEKQKYLTLIVAKIQKHFFVDDSMRGKKCSVNIQLLPTGHIERATVVDGYGPLCESSLKAITNASPFPMSDNPAVYEALKDLTPTLSPQLR